MKLTKIYYVLLSTLQKLFKDFRTLKSRKIPIIDQYLDFSNNFFFNILSFRVRDSLNQMSINENQEQTCKKKETEFLSKKANEYAGHVRHAEVFICIFFRAG